MTEMHSLEGTLSLIYLVHTFLDTAKKRNFCDWTRPPGSGETGGGNRNERVIYTVAESRPSTTKRSSTPSGTPALAAVHRDQRNSSKKGPPSTSPPRQTAAEHHDDDSTDDKALWIARPYEGSYTAEASLTSFFRPWYAAPATPAPAWRSASSRRTWCPEKSTPVHENTCSGQLF